MKQIPVIQPESGTQATPPAEEKTASLVNDDGRLAAMRPRIVDAIRTVFDPEIPVNIYDLGLIYDILMTADDTVGIRMTLTAPNCPAAQWLPGQVEQTVKALEGVKDVVLDVVFDPPWDRDRMSEAAKLQLGLW
jgi:FeS assembly SUF system protein